MAMNGLAGVAHVLETLGNEVFVGGLGILDRSRVPIERMLAFTAALKSGQPAGALVPNIGAA
jgi:quinolinate synthase